MNFSASRFVNKAYYFVEKQNFVEAIACLKKAIEADPDNDEVYAYLGEVYIFNQEYEKAMEAFSQRDEKVLKANHLTPYIEGYRGRIYLERGEKEKAEKLLEKALEKEAKDPEILYSLALLKASAKEYEKAYNVLRQIERQDPSFYYKKIQNLMKKLPEEESSHENCEEGS